MNVQTSGTREARSSQAAADASCPFRYRVSAVAADQGARKRERPDATTVLLHGSHVKDEANAARDAYRETSDVHFGQIYTFWTNVLPGDLDTAHAARQD